MSVLILRPNEDHSIKLMCSPSSPITHYDKVDEETLSTTDYLFLNDSTVKTDIFGCPDHTSESGTINSVTVKLKGQYNLTGTCAYNQYCNPALEIDSTIYYSGDQTLTASTAEYYYTWSTNPATSSAWGSDWSIIDSLLAGLSCTSQTVDSKNYKAIYIYQLWVEVDYTAGGGSPVFLPNIMKHNFIPPLIGGY